MSCRPLAARLFPEVDQERLPPVLLISTNALHPARAPA
jgi:hypothetical protein